jgi:hypothetical protein
MAKSTKQYKPKAIKCFKSGMTAYRVHKDRLFPVSMALLYVWQKEYREDRRTNQGKTAA